MLSQCFLGHSVDSCESNPVVILIHFDTISDRDSGQTPLRHHNDNESYQSLSITYLAVAAIDVTIIVIVVQRVVVGSKQCGI